MFLYYTHIFFMATCLFLSDTIMASCLDYALKYIHTYPKTEQELRVKLFTKKYTESEIDHTIQLLKTKWYIDDIQFTRLYIQSEISKKWKIPYLIRNKLLHKWVSKIIINDIMEQYEDDMQQGILDRIRKDIQKYKKKWLDGYEIVTKIAQKGYKISDIRKAIKEE